jgi:fructuronate reductase
MKVTVCLNPLHTTLAVFGCLLGYDAIWKEMADPELSKLIRVIGYDEGFPVSPDPGIISPKSFLDEVISDRFPNPFLPDTPQRIATDTSQKVGIRFGETIKAHMARGSAGALIGIPLALAGWLRYLDATDDAGNCMKLSDDPRLHELTSRTAADILRDAGLFGVDLYEAGLADRILLYLERMREGVGAVRRTLREIIS